MKEMHTRFFFTFKISTNTHTHTIQKQDETMEKRQWHYLDFFSFFCCRCRRPKRFEEEKKITRKPNEQKNFVSKKRDSQSFSCE